MANKKLNEVIKQNLSNNAITWNCEGNGTTLGIWNVNVFCFYFSANFVLFIIDQRTNKRNKTNFFCVTVT